MRLIPETDETWNTNKLVVTDEVDGENVKFTIGGAPGDQSVKMTMGEAKVLAHLILKLVGEQT